VNAARPALEVIRPNPAPGRLRHAVFDFDGTLSLLRAGWQQVMADQMVEALSAAPEAEPEPVLRAIVDEPVQAWAGRPTLDQMQWLAEAVAARGGRPSSAEDYKAAYLERLAARVRHRAEVEAGRVPAERYRVAGALQFVAALHAREVACHIASGTDEAAVREEARLLGFDPYLSEIRGARPDGSDAKRALIDQLAGEHRLGPGELAAFGDGRAELECARAVGGLAVAVASDEAGGGDVDARKRARLLAAGADVVVPHFHPPAALLNFLFPDG
jgi:phosphoglycolate phosphatase-like HAD superfamily hydrolase